MPGHLKLSAIGWAGNTFCYIVGKSFSISVVFSALQLLSKPKFSVLEKIKTIGSTYMVAAGLQPGKEGERSVTRSISYNTKKWEIFLIKIIVHLFSFTVVCILVRIKPFSRF